MKFFDVFWNVWKVRTSIKIQQTLENSYVEAKRRAQLNSNLPQIINALETNQQSFGSELEKQRKLIQVEKALRELPTMNLSEEEKKVAKEELLKVREFLNS